MSEQDNPLTGITHKIPADQHPNYVGYWELGGQYGLRLCQSIKPRWLTRLLMGWILEIRWKDGEPW